MDPPASSTDEAPPSYHDSVSNRSAPLPPEKSIYSPHFDAEDAGDGPSTFPVEAPPPFTLTPITLAILPNSMLIEPCTHNTRALYELTRPLSGHARTVGICEILPTSRLSESGMFKNLKEKEKSMLWRVYENLSFPRTKNATAISDQRRGREDLGDGNGVVLRKRAGLGSREWLAKGEGVEGLVLHYSARQKKGIVTWKNEKGVLVAVETPAVDRETEAEKLEILTEMGKEDTDLLVGCWVGRLHQELQKEGEKEEKKEAKERKEEQWARDAAEGKPYGRLHELKENLGIGFGVKPRHTGLLTGGPALTEDGRIKWS